MEYTTLAREATTVLSKAPLRVAKAPIPQATNTDPNQNTKHIYQGHLERVLTTCRSEGLLTFGDGTEGCLGDFIVQGDREGHSTSPWDGMEERASGRVHWTRVVVVVVAHGPVGTEMAGPWTTFCGGGV